MLFLTDKFDPNLFSLPDNQNDEFTITYRIITKEKLEKLVEVNRSRVLYSKKEIVNLFNNQGKLKIEKPSKIVVKKFDYIVFPIENDKYLLFDLVESKSFCKAFKIIHH